MRPPDFDDQVAKRYGPVSAPFRNPYPLPGEDPNATNGGSGQLPLGLTQGPNEWVNPLGYVAPPLYGTWATAPYFHNGSVPSLWAVLKPSDRPKVWKRVQSPTGWGGKNAGFDYSYNAYDFQKLGRKSTALACSDSIFSNPSSPAARTWRRATCCSRCGTTSRPST